MKLKLVVVALVAAIALAACSGSSDSGGQPGDDLSKFDPVPGMKVRQDQLPISTADQTLIQKAESRLANACMAKLGFPPATGVEQYAMPDPPSYLSPKDLRRGGYQFDFSADAEAFLAANGPNGPPSPTEGMSAEEADEYSKALLGTPDGPSVELPAAEGSSSTSKVGCQAEAREELFGSLLNYLRYDRALAANNAGPVAKQLARDKQYQAALSKWQTCMDAAGYPMKDDIDYGARALRQEQSAQLAESGTPLDQSRIDAVANADADCQEESGLYSIREKLLPAAREAIAKRLGLESGELIAFQNAVLAKAKTVR